MEDIKKTHPSFDEDWKFSSDLDGYIEVPTKDLIEAIQKYTIDKILLKKFLLKVQHELNDNSKADIILMDIINELE